VCDWIDGCHHRCHGERADPPDNQCTAEGSIIAVESQSLGEAVEIAGTLFRLHYQSDRVLGRTAVLGGAPFDARTVSLGGWSLDVHHAYHHYFGRLYLGDGRRRSSDSLGQISRTPAGEMVIAAEDGGELYVFDSQELHQRTLDALTSAVRYRFGYDRDGRLATITDGDGDATTIERDSGGAPTAIIGPFGLRTALTLDANGYLSEIANPAGEVFRAEYTADGLMISFTDPRGNTRHYAYDGLGRLAQTTDPAGGANALGRTDQPQGYTVTLATALGRGTTYQVENTTYEVEPPPERLVTRTVTGPDGLRAKSIDDPAGGTFVSETPDGVRTEVKLAPDPRWGQQVFLPNQVTISMPSGLAATTSVTRAVELTDPADPLSLAAQTDTVALNGRAYTGDFKTATRTHVATTPEGRQVVTTFDVQGRVIQAEAASLLPTHYEYDAHGRLSASTQGAGPEARSFGFSYDADGELAAVTDPLGRTESFTYDDAGRLIARELPDGRSISYAYDRNGNLISITPPGRPAHLFAYTPIDLAEEYSPPEVGTHDGSTLYSYNPDGQLTRVTRPDGQAVNLSYDVAGRLGELAWPGGQIGYGYNPATGQLASMTADGGTLNYAYDGPLLTEMSWGGEISGTVRRTYDSDFRMSSLSVNAEDPIGFAYDADGLLILAGDLALSRDPDTGLITGTALDAVSEGFEYNGFGELTAYAAAYEGGELFAARYARDKLGRITRKVETIAGVAEIYDYTYDPAGRLSSVKRDGTTIATYDYDANGNRLRVAGPGGGLGRYDVQDRLVDYDGRYNYNANGELESKTVGGATTTYSYEVLGNLLGVTLPDGTEITYLVDGQNRRIGKKMNGALVQGFLYQDDLRPIAELDDAGTVVSRFIYAGEHNVPDHLIKGGVIYRIISDHLGSPRLIVNAATGEIAQRLDYGASGEILLDTNPGFQPFGFAGGLYDGSTGLVRFGARDYDPITGRWTAKDPLLFATGETGLYLYVGNDPVNRADPFGLAPNDAVYKTPLDAAKAALSDMLPQSLKDNWEYGSQIFQDKNTGNYYYVKPYTSKDEMHVAHKRKKGVKELVAVCHTHTKETDIRFSRNDVNITKNWAVDNYLATANGRFAVYKHKMADPTSKPVVFLGGPGTIPTRAAR
jgi:RHS repeat-associated protein